MKEFLKHAVNLKSLFFTSFSYSDGNMAQFLELIFNHSNDVVMCQPKQIGLYRNKIDNDMAQEIVHVLGKAPELGTIGVI